MEIFCLSNSIIFKNNHGIWRLLDISVVLRIHLLGKAEPKLIFFSGSIQVLKAKRLPPTNHLKVKISGYWIVRTEIIRKPVRKT